MSGLWLTQKLFNLSLRLIRPGGASARSVQPLAPFKPYLFPPPRVAGEDERGGFNGLNDLNGLNLERSP